MNREFYHTQEYKEKQSAITKENWINGVYDFKYKREMKKCSTQGCENIFEVTPHDHKLYCSQSCANGTNNLKRGFLSDEIKQKIAQSLKGKSNKYKGVEKVPKIKIICANPNCKSAFFAKRWLKEKFCNVNCSIAVIGSRPTSPRASRGKAGIRYDISDKIYFYSRWEANLARLFNYLKINWTHQPKSFDISFQTYTPDFYLPDYNIYIEVKNFLWKYSAERDRKFREIYPNIKLLLLLKEEYLQLEKNYAGFINTWEYKNSPFLIN